MRPDDISCRYPVRQTHPFQCLRLLRNQPSTIEVRSLVSSA